MQKSGYSTFSKAGERLLGFGIRATRERVRVGRVLRQLPRIERALEAGASDGTRAHDSRAATEDEGEGTTSDETMLRHAAIVLRHLRSCERCTVDELCEATGLGASAVDVGLCLLQLRGAAECLSASGYYAACAA